MKQSKFFKTRKITEKLRDLDIGDSLILELNPEITFDNAMGTVTATITRLNIKVKQTSFRVVANDMNNNEIYRFIRIQRES